MQSYNHILPKSIIKEGWGYKNKNSKNYSVNSLNYERLNSFMAKHDSLSKEQVQNYLQLNFGKLEDVSLEHCITKRNPDNIMGNKLVMNLTEEKLGYLNLHVEKDIESKLLEVIRNNNNNSNNSLYYNWIALQKCRSKFELIKIYNYFLEKNTKKSISNIDEYSKFKSFYNEMVHAYFNEHHMTYKTEKYNVYIMDDFPNKYYMLGEGNTFNLFNLSKAFKFAEINKIGINLNPEKLKLIDISLISSTKIVFLYSPIIKKEELDLICKIIKKTWNHFQVDFENNILVVPEKYSEEFFTPIIDVILYRKNNKIPHNEYSYKKDYNSLLNLSDKFEKMLKV